MSENYWTRIRRPGGQGAPSPATRALNPIDRRRFLSTAAVATGAGVLIACGGGDDDSGSQGAAGTQAPSGTQAAQQAPANVPKGGTVTTATIGTDARSFHIYQTTDNPSSVYQGFVYDASLTSRDPNSLDHIGNAAEKWTLSDDKRTFTFTLKDIKWSDGTPLTAADYQWTYDQAIKPDNKYPRLQTIQEIESYRALDAKTLQVTLKEALSVGIETANYIEPLPKHIWERYDWGDPTKNPEIQAPTVVSGPFKLKEWKKDQFATFVRNDTYWDGAPNIEQLTYRIFGTQALAFQALKAGELDVHSIQPSDVKEAKTFSNTNVLDYYSATGGYTYAGFNMRKPYLKDVNVRRAIAYATDRKGIIDKVAYEQGRPVYSHYTQSSWVYNATVEKYDYDPKKAADLFKQAGWTLNSNKKLVKDGQELKLKILFNQGNNVREGISTVLQQQLDELGATVEVIPMEFQAYLQAIKTEPYDYDIFVLGWTAAVDPHFSIQIWSEKGIPELNSGAYVNKEIERLYEQGQREFDNEKRKQIYGQIQKLMAEDPPYVFVYEGKANVAVSKKIGGVQPSKLGILYNINKWYMNA